MPVQRVRFEIASDFTLCFLDFQDLRTLEDLKAAMAAARPAIDAAAPFSLRVLTDVSGSHISATAVFAMQEFVRANAPFVVKSAVVGLSLPHRVALRQIRRLTGRDIREFTSRDEAIAYLTA